jgi:hypothetical protein
MEPFYFLSEKDFKRWIKEVFEECQEKTIKQNNNGNECCELLDRKEVAKRLHISLVTLTDWVKRGLPCHKQRGRVYFIYREVLEYIQKNNSSKARLLSGSQLFRI